MHRLANTLREAGLTVWTDERLEPGTPSWQKAIEGAIDAADCLVVILSPHAKKSEWVNREIGYARARDVKVFPALASGEARDSVPIALIDAQYVDLRGKYDAGVRRLVSAIRRLVSGGRQTAVEPEPLPAVDEAPGDLVPDRVRLRNLLSDGFSSAELGELAFDLGLNYDDLAGSGKSAKIIELITYFERRGRYEELVQAAQTARPELDW